MQSTDTKTIDSALKSLAADEALSIRISGTCMVPLINDGAMVRVHWQKWYLPGDILVKRCKNGQLVAHRLLGCYPRKSALHYITRADNAEVSDAAIQQSQIIGRISGGECDNAVSNIPLRHRLRASCQFTQLVAQQLFRKINPAA